MRLVDTVFWIKISIRFIIFGVIAFIMSYYVYVLFFHKAPTPAQIFTPDFACGALPELQIKSLPIDVSKAKIEIPAEDSTLLDYPPIVYVYPIIPKGETFSTKQKALQLAESLQFSPQIYQKPNPITMLWEDRILQRKLTINTQTLGFNYTYLPSAFPRLPNTQLPPQSVAIQVAKDSLATLGLLTQPIRDAKTIATAVTIQNDIPHSTSALINAHAIRIDFQKPIKALRFPKKLLKVQPTGPIKFEDYLTDDKLKPEDTQEYDSYRVADKPITGNISVYVKMQGKDIVQNILRIDYQDWQVADTPCGTYPIISPATALKKLQNGEAPVVDIILKGGDKLNPDLNKLPEISNITIYSIELNYLENNTVQKFLQPIYIAHGDVVFVNRATGSIAFYIPAIEQRSGGSAGGAIPASQ